MGKGKIQELFPEKYEIQQKLEKDWKDFLKRDTYLIDNEKRKFFQDIYNLNKFPHRSLFKFKERGYIRKFRKELHKIIEEINNYPQKFIDNRLKIHSSFLEGKDDRLKYPLDDEQRLAVIKDDKHNLVIAGAGSGKTSVISSRIAYLVRRKDTVNKDKILALAFTKVAADEMKERLKKNYGIEIDISTFHALGRSIIKEELGHKPKLIFDGNEKKIYELIENLFMDVLKEEEFQNILINYLAYHSEQEVKKESFEDKEEYYNYMRNKNYSTLNNITVKSVSERNIGNFLFLHGIHFDYEPLAEWVDESEEEKEYHPDFFLPKYKIYIEHWGLNRNNQVPEWFTKTTEDYLELKEWKLNQFEKHNKNLIETWDYERPSEKLLPNLKENLKRAIPELDFVPLTYKELVDKSFEFKDKRNEIVNLVGNFIKISKCNFFTVGDITERIKGKKYSKKQKLFGELALEVYKRYQDYLNKENQIDFNDMINLAVELTKREPEKYINRYDHVLVDEFQDISYQRLELIKCFVNDNSSTKLFCVGDDWQSIYQFTGSDVRFFVNFKDYFPNPEITYLNNNYRSSQTIVGISNELIAKNKKQIAKETRSNLDIGMQPVFIDFTSGFNYNFKVQYENIYNLIQILLDDGVEPQEIMVLSRFNKYLKGLEIYCGAKGVPTESKHGGVRFYSAHKSKGSESQHVILTDMTSGLYGFPCEIQDSSVMELAKRFESDGFIDEERRLFYVALTRSKKFIYIYSLEQNNSIFLNEINPYLMRLRLDATKRWDEGLSDYMKSFIKGILPDTPISCPKCDSFLVKRNGKKGKFLGCSRYPKCNYTKDLEDLTERYEDRKIITVKSLPRFCKQCGKHLAIRKGQYGGFLGCTGYPKCRFTFNLSSNNPIICPNCGSPLVVRKGKYGAFLGCANYPRCKYLIDSKKFRRG
ncbi:MAG: UvrD-helicase domain-containing protein [Promethearchaeota archaeon]|jgi:DNA helicase-4